MDILTTADAPALLNLILRANSSFHVDCRRPSSFRSAYSKVPCPWTLHLPSQAFLQLRQLRYLSAAEDGRRGRSLRASEVSKAQRRAVHPLSAFDSLTAAGCCPFGTRFLARSWCSSRRRRFACRRGRPGSRGSAKRRSGCPLLRPLCSCLGLCRQIR